MDRECGRREVSYEGGEVSYEGAEVSYEGGEVLDRAVLTRSGGYADDVGDGGGAEFVVLGGDDG